MWHILGRAFKLGGMHGRNPLPGFGLQGLHSDWPPRSRGEPCAVATALWLFDDFTPYNGATRIVPRSHHKLGAIPKSYAQPHDRHPDEELVIAPAGSLLVFNGHLWHAGTLNRSSGPRRVAQVVFHGSELANAYRSPE